MKKIILLFILILFPIFAQGTAGVTSKYEPRLIIDMPTAGVIEKRAVGITLDLMPDGVVITKMEVGVFENFSFGISYGASNLIGNGAPGWYKLPGINARMRLINETDFTPALTLGFDSQGKGAYFDGNDRYEYKSPGFFAAVSKNYQFLGYLSFHAGVNYSLERGDNDKDLNLYFGAEKTIGSQVSILAEYNVAINDNSGLSIGDGKGYLSMGLRWSVGSGFTLGMNFRNLLDNNKRFTTSFADRALVIEYIQTIF